MTRALYALGFSSLVLAACATEPTANTAVNVSPANGDTTTATPPSAVSCEPIPARSDSGPTLLIVNTSCLDGACLPLKLRMSPPGVYWPSPVGGAVAVGNVCGRSACLRYPAVDTLWVGTTPIIWTAQEPVVLSAYGWSGRLRLGITTQFSPGASSGWRITLPNDGEPATPVPAPPCNP